MLLSYLDLATYPPETSLDFFIIIVKESKKTFLKFFRSFLYCKDEWMERARDN